ncbi:MAG: type II toxin-antitoxin system VapC family toxin [Solirubrobacterales bacterium]
MKVVADTGPLFAAAHRSDSAHGLASAIVTALGRDLIVLDSVIVEVDQLLRSRIGAPAGRGFLAALVAGEHTTTFLSPGILGRAAEIDSRFADLGLGLVDGSVMAYAERHELPILTFDFEHFRAATPARGHWRLVVDEARDRDETGT